MVVAAVFMTCLNGCPDSSDQDDQTATDRPFVGLEIEAAAPGGLGFPSSWELVLDEWHAQTGAVATLHEYDPANMAAGIGFRSASGGDLADSAQPGRDTADMLVFPLTAVPELDAAGVLAAVPDDVSGADGLDYLDIFQGLREQVGSIGREPRIVPISCPVLVCYYRRDLLDAAGLKPPETWDDYQALLEGLDDWAGGLTAVEPWGEAYRATLFLARAVAYAKHPGNYSLYFDISSQEPLIDREGFVRALQKAQAAVSRMPTEVAGYTPADCRREIISGRAALAITFETGPDNPEPLFAPSAASAGRQPPRESTQTADVRPESSRIGFSRLPGAREVYNTSRNLWESLDTVNHVTLTGFAGLAVGVSATSQPKQAEAAWNLAVTLAVERATSAFPNAAQSPCRQSQRGTALKWVGPNLSESEAQGYVGVVASSLRDTRLVVELPVVGRALYRQHLSDGIGQALAGELKAQDALREVAKQWRAVTARIIQETGDEHAVRDSYRRSLNLP